MTTNDLDYTVKVPISADIEIDGVCFGTWEGWALSYPGDPSADAVCLRDDSAPDGLGRQLPSPRFGGLIGKPHAIAAAAEALWAIAQCITTTFALRDAMREHIADRKEQACADAGRARYE